MILRVQTHNIYHLPPHGQYGTCKVGEKFFNAFRRSPKKKGHLRDSFPSPHPRCSRSRCAPLGHPQSTCSWSSALSSMASHPEGEKKSKAEFNTESLEGKEDDLKKTKQKNLRAGVILVGGFWGREGDIKKLEQLLFKNTKVMICLIDRVDVNAKGRNQGLHNVCTLPSHCAAECRVAL